MLSLNASSTQNASQAIVAALWNRRAVVIRLAFCYKKSFELENKMTLAPCPTQKFRSNIVDSLVNVHYSLEYISRIVLWHTASSRSQPRHRFRASTFPTT